MSKAPGNGKPDLIICLEHGLWRILLAVVKGKNTLFPTMQSFMEGIDWSEFKMLPDSVLEFFADSEL
jgi:hypothetical protein